MSMTFSSQPMPTLFSIAMSDWLPKLGEKAFLAWLRLHSWKSEPASSSPASLPFSLNRIIKRLKVGNSTFYDQILRPLWNYGLIDLQPAGAGQKHQIILYSFPLNDPEKRANPLLQIRDYDLSTPHELSSPDKETILPEKSISEREDSPLLESPEVPSIDHSSVQDSSFIQEDTLSYHTSAPIVSSLEQVNDDPTAVLPSFIQQAIRSDQILWERSVAIVDVYLSIKDDPRYSDEYFLRKTHTCSRYSHDPNRFAAYLKKSIQNDWARQPKPAKLENQKPSFVPSACPPGVPPWVHRQQELQKSGIQPYPTECSPEEKAELAWYLEQMGED